MTGCACETSDKVIAFPSHKIKKGEDTSQVDKAILAALDRQLDKVHEKSSEITVFDPDMRAIQDEDVFRKRFGFALGPRGRKAMFEVIGDYDLTNDEVRRLHRAGCIRWDGKTLQISANKLFLYAGWIYYGLVSLIVIFCGAVFILADKASVTGRLTLFAICTVGFIALTFLRRDFIDPHYLKSKRVSRDSSN